LSRTSGWGEKNKNRERRGLSEGIGIFLVPALGAAQNGGPISVEKVPVTREEGKKRGGRDSADETVSLAGERNRLLVFRSYAPDQNWARTVPRQ